MREAIIKVGKNSEITKIHGNVTTRLFCLIQNSGTKRFFNGFCVWMAWSKHAGMLRELKKSFF